MTDVSPYHQCITFPRLKTNFSGRSSCRAPQILSRACRAMHAERWPTFGRQSGSRPRVQRKGWHPDCHVRQGKAAPSDVSTRHAARRSRRRSASALFDQIRNALSSSSAVGVSGGDGAPADGKNDTAMPEVELAGPTLRTDAQRPSRSVRTDRESARQSSRVA